MTKDELIREINNCSSFCAFCYDGSTINIIAENLENSVGKPENFMNSPDDVECLVAFMTYPDAIVEDCD